MAFFRLDPDAYLFSRIGSGSVQPWPGSAALPLTMVKDGCSFHYTHTWSKSDISICWRHLVTSKESSNPIFFSEKRPCLHHTWATWNEQPSNMKTMRTILARILTGVFRRRGKEREKRKKEGINWPKSQLFSKCWICHLSKTFRLVRILE